jgi:hypothetical protein
VQCYLEIWLQYKVNCCVCGNTHEWYIYGITNSTDGYGEIPISGINGITISTDGCGKIPISGTYEIMNSTVGYGEIPISGIFPNEWDYKFN